MQKMSSAQVEDINFHTFALLWYFSLMIVLLKNEKAPVQQYVLYHIRKPEPFRVRAEIPVINLCEINRGYSKITRVRKRTSLLQNN